MLNVSSSTTTRRPTALRREPLALLRRVADSLLAVLIAPACAACATSLDRPTRGPVCDRCWSGIVPLTPPFCVRCGDPLASWRASGVNSSPCPRCRRHRSAVAAARTIGPYDGSLRAIVHAFKYGRRPSLGQPLGRLMAASAGHLLADVDLVVPVPLHWRRRRSRGFNQAAELARHLGPAWREALRRTRVTSSQTGLSAAERQRNVRHAFTLRRRAQVNGLTILLVDDVSTTGATLEACAGVLLAAGAREVRALTAARVVSTSP